MKKTYVFLAIAFLTIINAQSQTKLLVVENCPCPLEIIEGVAFKFPDNLKQYDVTLQTNEKGYIVKGIASGNGGSNSGMSINQVNGKTTITQNGKTTVINDSYNGSNSVSINNNQITINGKKVDNSGTKTKPIQTLKIIVPKNIDLTIKGSGDVKVIAPINNLRLGCNGTGDMQVEKVNTIKSLVISGSGDVRIKFCKTIDNVAISGSGTIIIDNCESIVDATVSGSGDIIIPKNTKVESEMISGSGEITKK